MRSAVLISRLSVALSLCGCDVDERQPNLAAAGSDGVSPDSAPVVAPAADAGQTAAPGMGETSATPGATSIAPPDPCAGLPLSRCQCVTDEATTCGAVFPTLGACAARAMVCREPGVWPPASDCAPMSPELCDPGEVDDDCDGETDEGCVCINTSEESCGIDGAGTRVCSSGVWQPCRCELESALDVDQNGIADAVETLLTNGAFTSDLGGWLQSQRDNEFDGVIFEFESEDATELSCSGAMLLTSTENAGDNFAEQCVTAASDDYLASAQVLLVENTNVAGVSAVDVDPSFVSLELAASTATDCQGTPLVEVSSRIELDPIAPSWETLAVRLSAPPATRSLRLRVRVVADAWTMEPNEFQMYARRAARWDNVILRAE